MRGVAWTSAALGLAVAPAAGAPPVEALPGSDACVSEHAGSCVQGKALDGAAGVAVSPNGLNVYVASAASDAVAVFDRDPGTGKLTQLSGTDGCVSDTGSGGDCADGRALDNAFAVTVSPDGANVYVGSPVAGIAIFDRDPVTGDLTQKAGTAGCINLSGSDGCAASGTAGSSPSALALSPDGRSLYSATGVGLGVFDRDPSSGVLTQKAGTAGCFSSGVVACTSATALEGPAGVAVSPDGRNVYVASFDSDAVATFDRDRSSGALTQKGGLAACVSETGTSGSCRDGAGLDGATSVAVSTDGFTVYVASSESDAIAVQSRNRSTGELTLKLGALKCVSETGSGGACADGVALDGIRRVAISADQRSVFATASNSGALAVFDRDTSIGTVGGALSQKPAPAGCVSFDGTGGSCATLLQTASATGLAVSPDGRNVYVTSLGNDAVSVFTRFVEAYDIDGDGTLQPLTDGLLLVRFLFGFSGNTLVNDAVNLADCTRCTAAAIEAYLESLSPTP